jgi:hypothetical protein
LSLDNLKECSKNLWWVHCCSWKYRSRGGVVGGVVVAVVRCFTWNGSSIWLPRSHSSPLTLSFRRSLIYDCNELLIFRADVKNGDTVANPLFSVSFDLRKLLKRIQDQSLVYEVRSELVAFEKTFDTFYYKWLDGLNDYN